VAAEEVVWVEQLVVVVDDGEGVGEHAAKTDDQVGYYVAFLGLVEADDLVHQLAFRVVEVLGLWGMASAAGVVAEALVLPYFHRNQK
jgi:hypothetical protein